MMMVMIIDLAVYFSLFVVGAVFGSFAGAQVWRCRARQLVEDSRLGEEVDASELKSLKPLLNKGVKKDRSVCLQCKHELSWFDMLPVFSWLFLMGRCRYCHESIGWTELILEISMGGLFVLSVSLWPGDLGQTVEVVRLALWLTALVVLAINFVYDMKWSLLVTKLNWLLIGLGLVFAIITVALSTDWFATILSVVFAVLILGGLYAMLWWVSSGRWVGEGDAYLGAGIALFLIDWKVSFLALFAANLAGTLVVLPSMLSGKLNRGKQIPFGPYLVIGGLTAWFAGPEVISWYQELVLFA